MKVKNSMLSKSSSCGYLNKARRVVESVKTFEQAKSAQRDIDNMRKMVDCVDIEVSIQGLENKLKGVLNAKGSE